jgi:phosphomannomutase
MGLYPHNPHNPHNGALRERVTRDEADEIVATDPDSYARIVP